jgi:pimeloyl-ACP methyl ester carboxylesterase
VKESYPSVVLLPGEEHPWPSPGESRDIAPVPPGKGSFRMSKSDRFIRWAARFFWPASRPFGGGGRSGRPAALLRLLVLALGMPAAALAAPAPVQEDPPAMANLAVREHLVDEPIFGGRAFILEAGRGNSPTIVLVHGLGDQASGSWAGIIPELASRYHVLAVDLPGFGRSDKGNLLYSPGAYAVYLRWLVDRFATGPLVMIGHSMGGAVALRFAADYPLQVERLVLANVAGILHRKVITRDMLEPDLRGQFPYLPSRPLARLENWMGSLITRMPELPLDLDQILANEGLRGRFLAGDPARIAATALVQENYSRTIRAVTAPTFIIWGEQDRIASPRTGILLESILPRVQLRVIPGAAHVPMAEQPLLFKAALREALTTVPATRSPPEGPADRLGRCQGEQGLVFSGRYDRLDITDCSEIRLTGVYARAVTITRSVVDIDRGAFRGADVTLRVIDSTVAATGLRVEGDTALAVANSRLDLAGVELIGREAAVRMDAPAMLLFSVSLVESSRGREFLHEVITLKNGAKLF